MARVESYRDYFEVFKGKYPENIALSEYAFAKVVDDERTLWALTRSTGVEIPAIYPGEYAGVNNDFMRLRGYRNVGFASLSPLIEFPLSCRGYDVVLEVGFGLDSVTPGYKSDSLVQFDGEQSTVRYFKAHVCPVEGVEYDVVTSKVSEEDFDYIWRELYYPRFSELSDEFPVSGTLNREYMWDLINLPSTMCVITRMADAITGFCLVCRLEDFNSYDIEYANRDDAEYLKWYCPVIVGNQSASAANALKMAKIIGKNIRSFGGGILYFDCPNRTYPYITKVVMAMREKESLVEPQCYVQAYFRLLIPCGR